MGYKLHCATKYDVKYSHGDFNHKSEEFHELLDALKVDYSGEQYDSEFEVFRKDWQEAIDKLKNLYSLPQDDQEDIMWVVKKMQYTLEHIIDSLECSEDALEFHVQGFLHTGNVRVIYIEGIDLFQVCLYDEEGNLVEQIESVHFDELAEVIDLKVENDKVGDYKAKVMKFLMYS